MKSEELRKNEELRIKSEEVRKAEAGGEMPNVK